jgi:hypothetical protein
MHSFVLLILLGSLRLRIVKRPWKLLEITHEGTSEVKVSRLMTLTIKFELFKI